MWNQHYLVAYNCELSSLVFVAGHPTELSENSLLLKGKISGVGHREYLQLTKLK